MADSNANYLRSPVLGKCPKLIRKGTKAAAAEAEAIATEATATVDLAEIKRLAAEFEALDGGALIMALAETAAPGDPCASADLRASGSACPRTARSTALKS
jgi:hypothetical protein